MSKKQDRIDELVANNDKEGLVSIAEAAGLDSSGTKTDIAERIVGQQIEQEKADTKDEESGKTDSKDPSPSETGTPAEPKNTSEAPPADQIVDQTGEAAARQKAAARREKFIKEGGHPDAPVPDDFDAEEDEDAEKENTAPAGPANPQATGIGTRS